MRTLSSVAAALLSLLLVLAVPGPLPGVGPSVARAEAAEAEVPPAPSDTPVRVGLAWEQTQAEVSSTGGLWIVADGVVHGEMPAGAPVRAYLRDGGVFLETLQAWFAGPVRLVPHPSGYISFQGRAYRGEVQLLVAAGKLSVVNVVNLEDYLLSVVPTEMDHRWPMEALKAQAVAARSYTVANLGRWEAFGFDLSNTTSDQVYNGIAQERPSTTAAVLETAGQVITYGGRVVPGYYHSSSGGHTENNEDIWTGGSPQGYLRGVPDYDSLPENKYTAWTSTFTPEEFSERLEKAGFGVGRVTAVRPGRAAASGRPATWEVVGTEGTATLTMQQMRNALGLFAPPTEIVLSGPDGPAPGAEPAPGTEPGDEPGPGKDLEPGPEPEPRPEPEPGPDPQAARVAVLGADGAVQTRALAGSYALGAGGVVRPVESLAVVASADDWMVVGVVTRPGTTPPSRGDSRPREPEPAPVPDTIVVTGSGHGHGVGMSQWGAHGMALQGKSYIEILTHYYTGTKVETR